MLLLTDVNAKVFCSACSALFRSDGTQQVVDFKGENGTFYMFVPMFHNIYKSTREAKHFTMLSDSGRLVRTSLVQTHKKGGTLEQRDNEAPKHLISLTFRPFLPTGTMAEHTEQCLKIKQKQDYLCNILLTIIAATVVMTSPMLDGHSGSSTAWHVVRLSLVP